MSATNERPFYDRDGIRLFHGDALDVCPTWPADALDAVITDGPYGLGFMGAAWDHGVPGVPFWTAALRAMKPGAALLAFGGTRTFHRLAVAIEDAGFELRDTLGWIYGSGFPKSLDVAKAIDDAAGVDNVVGEIPDRWTGKGSSLNFATDRAQATCKVTAPATDAAKAWDGWGTALKPAWEPIIMARKPLAGTVAANVLAYGTGALNLGTRDEAGRWPANILHDGSDEALAVFPKSAGGGYPERGGTAGISTSGHAGYGAPVRVNTPPGNVARFYYCAKAAPSERWAFCRECGATFLRLERARHPHGLKGWDHLIVHPTQKPLALMKYLVRLTVPSGALIADLFAGSGTTLIAAGACGVRAVGIERELDHCRIAAGRLALPLGF
jgi:site-specific DNA-methyltransferase (adenine-specific)